jgi:hypothetical protein
MTPQSRRVFLGSAAAAVTAGAGTLLVSGNAAFAQRSSPDDAALIAELQRQAREGVKAMRLKPGEGVRRVALALRAYAAHGKGRQIDAAVAARLRAAIAVHGREAILLKEIDSGKINAEMRELGITQRYTPRPIDYAARERLLNDLLKGGFTSTVIRFADRLEADSIQLDRDGVRAVPARYVDCYVFQRALDEAETMIMIFCNPLFSGVWAATCVFWSSYAATIWAQMRWYGC